MTSAAPPLESTSHPPFELPREPVVVVVGPTASGKSALAIEIATALRGEVVNVDSVQAYRELTIGSGKVTPQDRRGIPHHGLDIWNLPHDGDVVQSMQEALRACAQIQQRGRRAILVAASGLYVRVLLYGLAQVPQGDVRIRSSLAQHPPEILFQQLQARDPSAASRIHPSDTRRIIRALEICAGTQERASEVQARHGITTPLFPVLAILPIFPRSKLYARIDARVALMMASGLLEETRQVMRAHGTKLRVLESIGYRECVEYLSSGVTTPQREDVDALIARIQQRSRNLAKQQLTFWRNEPRKRGWVTLPLESESGSHIALVADQSGEAAASARRAFSMPPAALCATIAARLQEPFKAPELWRIDGDALAGYTTAAS